MQRDIGVVGAPIDIGGNRRGVDMGPSALRYAGLLEELDRLGFDCTDHGDIAVPDRHPDADERADSLDDIGTVAERLADRVTSIMDDGRLPLVLGGDHSAAIGTMHGIYTHDRPGLLWFDAHADLNTPQTSPSGNTHGMPVAAGLEYGSFADHDWAEAPGLEEENVVYVGLRNLDPAEKERVRSSDITAFTMTDIDERGIHDVVDEALDVALAGTDGVHVSLDMDWLDPGEAPGVGTPVNGGVTYREARRAMELVAERDALRGMEVVEVNPVLDEGNVTAEKAVDLVASAFGERIL